MSIVDRASTSPEEPFEPLGTYQTFAAASEIAKGLASDHQARVFVQRVGEGWLVRVPSWVKLFLDQSAEECRWMTKHSPYPVSDSELQDELRNELLDDAEDWSRSDQSGWFYPESDGGN